jgi:hypothetical protein
VEESDWSVLAGARRRRHREGCFEGGHGSQNEKRALRGRWMEAVVVERGNVMSAMKFLAWMVGLIP